MKRFRRRSGPRPPRWWFRDCFTNSLAVTTGDGAAVSVCGRNPIAADVLADGEVFASALDKEEVLTPLVIKRSISFNAVLSNLSLPHTFQIACLTVKCSANDLTATALGANDFDAFLGHNVLGTGNAFDVLDVRQFKVFCPGETAGTQVDPSTGIGQFHGYGVWNDDLERSWDIKVRRKLQSREKIAQFWWAVEIAAGLPTGATFVFRWNQVTSVLWQQTPRRR